MKPRRLLELSFTILFVAILALVLVYASRSTDASSAVFSEGYVANFHSITKAELAVIISDLAQTNPILVDSLAKDPYRRAEQLDKLKRLLTLANECVRTGLIAQDWIKAEAENIRIETIATGYEKLKFPAAKSFGSSVTADEIDDFKKAPTFKAALDAFLNTKLRVMNENEPSSKDRKITDEERSQAEDIFARTRILAAKAARDTNVPASDVMRFALQVKLQQAQFLAREFTDSAVQKDQTPITAEEIKLYRRTNKLTAATTDDEVRHSIQEERLEDSVAELADSARIEVPEDFEVVVPPAASPNRNSNLSVNRGANRGARNTRIH
jgi:hypothetical protein